MRRHLGLSLIDKEKLNFNDLNHKPDELQCYLLNISLKYYKKSTFYRAKLINRYKKNLDGKVLYCEHNVLRSSCYDYQILVNKRNSLFEYLKKRGIETRIKHPYLLSDQYIYSKKEKKNNNSHG